MGIDKIHSSLEIIRFNIYESNTFNRNKMLMESVHKGLIRHYRKAS